MSDHIIVQITLHYKARRPNGQHLKFAGSGFAVEQNSLAVTGVYFSSGLYKLLLPGHLERVRKELGMNLTRRDMIGLTTALPAAAWLNNYDAFAAPAARIKRWAGCSDRLLA